jgi:hypothetical protein
MSSDPARPVGAGGSARGLPRIPESESLIGSFDGLDNGCEASGWLLDLQQPARPCSVELRVDGVAVTQAPANLPRADLRSLRLRMESGFRIGLPASVFDGIIHSVEVFAVPEGLRIGAARPIAAIIADHRTTPKIFSVDSILKLRDPALDYDSLFPAAFLQRHGVRAAVAYAYLWLLKRPPDRSGWDHYSARILAGEVGLGAFLRDLAASEEAQAARRAGIDLALEFEAVLAAAARLPPPRRKS